VNKDEFVISLEVAGNVYQVPVKRNDEREEYLLRKAAKRVQQHVIQYRQYLSKEVTERDLLAAVVIHLAKDVVQLEEQNDTERYIHKIQQLTDMLENYLKK
jgi:hypothetical protein